MKCLRCNHREAWYHTTDGNGEYIRVCAQCLTRDERAAIERERIDAMLDRATKEDGK